MNSSLDSEENFNDEDFEKYLEEETQIFEQALLFESKNPLERALARKNFYTKKNELRKQWEKSNNHYSLDRFKRNHPSELKNDRNNKRHDLNNIKYLDSREYIAGNGKRYKGPPVPKEYEKFLRQPKFNSKNNQNNNSPNDEEENTDINLPVFVEEDGALFDKYYYPISQDEISEDSEEYKKITESAELLQNPPCPEYFETFNEYEEALLKWSEKCKSKLSHLQLPRVMGRHYFRPKLSPANSNSDKTVSSSYNSDTPDKNSTQSVEFNSSQKYSRASISSVNIDNGWDTNSRKASSSAFNDSNLNTTDSVSLFDQVARRQCAWEANLVPIEPKPEFYQSFEEYEGAMIRWYLACCGMSFMPPHASQLEELIGIKQNKKYFPPGETTLDPFPGIDPARHGANIESLNEEADCGNEWNNLTEETQQTIRNTFDKILDQRIRIKHKIGHFHSHSLWKTHPNLLSSKIRMINNTWTFNAHRYQQNMSGSDEYIKLKQHNLPHQIPLDATNLPDDVRFPDFEVGTINFSRLQESKYLESIKTRVSEIEHQDRYSQIISCNNESQLNQSSNSFVEKMNEKIHEIIKNPNINNIFELIMIPAYLDTFIQWLDTPSNNGEQNSGKTNKQILFDILDIELVLDLISSSQNSTLELVYSKLSWILDQIMQYDWSVNIVNSLLEKENSDLLYYFTILISQMNSIPLEVYYYEQEIQSFIIQKYGEDVNQIVVQCSKIYALKAISISKSDTDKTYPILDHLDSMEKESCEKLRELLEDRHFFVEYTLWKLLTSRIRKISRLGWSIFSLLYFNIKSHKEIQKIIWYNPDMFFSNIRSMAKSKFSHVKDLAIRLFPRLLEEPFMRKTAEYYRNPQHVLEDLCYQVPFSTSSSPSTASPLLPQLVLDFLINSMKNTTASSLILISGLIENNLFGKILSFFKQDWEKKKISSFLVHFVDCLVERQAIDLKQDKGKTTSSIFGSKLKQRRASNQADEGYLKIFIEESDIDDLLLPIWNPIKTSNVYNVKLNMLRCLRKLLKRTSIFEVFKRYSNLFSTLPALCKDDLDMDLNREAWRIFYHSIKYNKDVIELFIKSNIILQLVNTLKENNSSIVFYNAFHYINKTFLLGNKDPSNWHKENPSQEVASKYRNSVQSLVNYLTTNNFFQDVMYRSYCQLYQEEKGGAFQSMAQLYLTIITIPCCRPILKGVEKNTEFKESLDHIRTMKFVKQ